MNINDLHYLSRLEEDADARDYDAYPGPPFTGTPDEIRQADRDYINKVATAIRDGKPVWATR